ncbi:MAG: hypothetical protein AAGA85_23115, partial [Bacteroidota bacterium]
MTYFYRILPKIAQLLWSLRAQMAPFVLGWLCSVMACEPITNKTPHMVTSDIYLFWEAYDRVSGESDSVRQIQLFDSMYLQRGTIGLQRLMQARNYTAAEYVELINRYPRYWNSIRPNTLKVDTISRQFEQGIQKFKALYPDLRPATIYFEIGAMRTNGTAMDSVVLIGCELAFADSRTDISEFEGATYDWLSGFFRGNPIDQLGLLSVHEYVHTQQEPIPDYLLGQVLYEGIAEFIATVARQQPSYVPAIAFGERTPEVREQFEAEMFYGRTHEWLWSNAPNVFGVRDLGYYIGYAIAKAYHQQAGDKLQCIKTLVELDYADRAAVYAVIDQSGFFSKSITQLALEDKEKRPVVSEVVPLTRSTRE